MGLWRNVFKYWCCTGVISEWGVYIQCVFAVYDEVGSCVMINEIVWCEQVVFCRLEPEERRCYG